VYYEFSDGTRSPTIIDALELTKEEFEEKNKRLNNQI
jgi:hypothetical protein